MVKDKKSWITLNVGGQYFTTSRSTLTRLTPSNSPLHRISTNSTHVHFDRDDRGAYFIDRDPAYFSVVLNYLRHGHLLLNREVTEEGVLVEADYFGLPDLARAIRQRLGQRSLAFSSLNHHHHHQQQQQHQQQSGQQVGQLGQHHHQQQQHQPNDIFSSWAHTMGLSSLNSTPSSAAALTNGFSNMLEV